MSCLDALFSSVSPPPAVGSPSLPDKYRNNREMLMLLPPHRERPSSAMYPNITENGQPTNFQRALFHQVIGPCKPCSDPNLSVAEKGTVDLAIISVCCLSVCYSLFQSPIVSYSLL
ncbi:unnamed protein product [Oncorhynchus mykiss]|uniref:Uncharacterized protein n=1 Tax=Oncorhynchus mykiss TaxID=8022 RepID=A0A060Z270_ONCMY|nr:unnamed protein product [Oncorhynchus mykiss]